MNPATQRHPPILLHVHIGFGFAAAVPDVETETGPFLLAKLPFAKPRPDRSKFHLPAVHLPRPKTASSGTKPDRELPGRTKCWLWRCAAGCWATDSNEEEFAKQEVLMMRLVARELQ